MNAGSPSVPRLTMPALALLTSIALAGAANTNTSTHTTSRTATIAYPAKGSTLALLELKPPRRFKKKRIFIDPGHGFTGNEGATTALCELERDATLRIAKSLADHLAATGRFTVKLARTGPNGPTYDRRLDDSLRFRADAIISIHLDARGFGAMVSPPGAPDLVCPRNDDQPGFGVLVADRQGDATLLAKRRRLARSLALRLAEIGLPPYDGYDYGSMYELDPTPGVFLDRRRLFMLRRPSIPSVIVETHHGWHLDEAERWREDATLAAFARAIEAGLTDALAD